MSEAELQQAVIACAQTYGWTVAHFRPARVVRGGREIYETPVDADGKGFPDLVMVRASVTLSPDQSRVIFVELKSEQGKLHPAQRGWGDLLERVMLDDPVGTVLYDVWRPADWLSGRIERILKPTRGGESHGRDH